MPKRAETGIEAISRCEINRPEKEFRKMKTPSGGEPEKALQPWLMIARPGDSRHPWAAYRRRHGTITIEPIILRPYTRRSRAPCPPKSINRSRSRMGAKSSGIAPRLSRPPCPSNRAARHTFWSQSAESLDQMPGQKRVQKFKSSRQFLGYLKSEGRVDGHKITSVCADRSIQEARSEQF